MQVPVEEGVFTWPAEQPSLIGSRCRQCGNHMFPVQSGCPRCTAADAEIVELGNRGTLWTWTIQGFPPKAPPYAGDVDPKTFQAFGVGYVELPGEVKVEARLTVADPGQLKIGMEMQMTIVPLATDAEGNEVVTFAFAPVQEGTPS
jgi:uncharacterized OB-fold protein